MNPLQRSHGALAPILASAICGAALALGGCASSAGVDSRARMIAPESMGLDSNLAKPRIADEWWRNFGDETLDGLVDRALAGNPTLHGVQVRLARAAASTASSRAAAGPQLNASLDVTRERLSATSIYPPPLGGSTVTLANAQLAASWEIDFFGRNRAAIEAAVGTERAAAADVLSARMLLATQVAHAYVQLARLIEQRQVAARTLKQRDEMLSLIRQRVASGL
ncbi:MAG TPA: TolC family protein, partial [Usitatibacter sp.]